MGRGCGSCVYRAAGGRGNHHHLPLLEIFELGPKFFQELHVALHAASKPTNPTLLDHYLLGGLCRIGYRKQFTICEGERPKKENVAI